VGGTIENARQNSEGKRKVPIRDCAGKIGTGGGAGFHNRQICEKVAAARKVMIFAANRADMTENDGNK
jgi:hypothetical protein